jgi:hypothetical protein
MLDLSPLVPWPFVVAGFVISLVAVHQMRGPKALGGIVAAGILSFVLGVLLTFATVWAQAMCVEGLHLCRSHGEESLSYSFHSFFAIPAFWIAMSMFGERVATAPADVTPCDNAVVSALAQFRTQSDVRESCPSCGSLISVERLSQASAKGATVLRTVCKCGKCSGEFELSVSGA